MAENTKIVNDFLAELLAETKSYADADYRMVADYAASLGARIVTRTRGSMIDAYERGAE